MNNFTFTRLHDARSSESKRERACVRGNFITRKIQIQILREKQINDAIFLFLLGWESHKHKNQIRVSQLVNYVP